MKNKKIMFVIGSLGKGGAERVISLLGNEFVSRGYRVKICLLLNSKIEYELNEKIEVCYLNRKRRFNILNAIYWIRHLRQEIFSYSPNYVISFVARINIISLIAGSKLNIPIIISERNDPKRDGRSIITKLFTYFCYKKASKIVFQTKWAQNCFPRNIRKNSVIIHNPIQINQKYYEYYPVKNRIISVGRLSKQKNHKLLIKAFKNIHMDYPDLKLYIYGEGVLRKKLEVLIKSLNLGGKVFLPGSTNDIYKEIRESSTFVLPSDYEGLSNAMMEAMTLKIPIVSTNCPGALELLVNDKSALIFPRKNRKKLEEALLRIINNPEYSLRLANEAFEKAKNFELEKIIEDWIKLIS